MASDRKGLSCSRNGSQRLRAKGATDWATLMAAQLEPHSFLLGSDSKHLDLRHLNFVLTAFPWTLPQQQCYLRLYLPSVFIYVVKPSNCQVIKYPKTIKKIITEGYENMKDVEIILWTPRFWDLNARKLLWCKEEDHEVEGWNHDCQQPTNRASFPAHMAGECGSLTGSVLGGYAEGQAPACSYLCHLLGSWNSLLDPLCLGEECGKRRRAEDPGRFLGTRLRVGHSFTLTFHWPELSHVDHT